MEHSRHTFLALAGKLRQLDAGTKPLWGIMTPQHMVEHLVGTWRISNGGAAVPQHTPAGELQEKLDFLFSDRPYPKNFKNPVLSQGLLPLRKASLEDAIAQLEKDIDLFFRRFEAEPGAKPVHPIFGPLDKHGWLVFQEKHMRHHRKQFGL